MGLLSSELRNSFDMAIPNINDVSIAYGQSMRVQDATYPEEHVPSCRYLASFKFICQVRTRIDGNFVGLPNASRIHACFKGHNWKLPTSNGMHGSFICGSNAGVKARVEILVTSISDLMTRKNQSL
jgi:hypothetical protein